MTIQKTIIFLDNTYPKAYQTHSIETQALGGTEASIIRTANILSENYKVYVVQKSRKETVVESDSLSYCPKSKLGQLNPDFIIVLRKYPLLKSLSQQFPKAKLFLWIHTYKNIEYVFKRKGLAKTNTTIICNSNTHKKHTDKLLNSGVLAQMFSFFVKKTKLGYCYNPIPQPKAYRLRRDSNKLLFFSSPNKGLDQVLKCFEFVSQRLPELKLYIANPGYKDDDIKESKKIVILGSLPHDQMMQQVASSLCVFYPQDSFAETFGLIYAEANAYGTPVLAHDIGSAREILDNNNDLCVTKNNYQAILNQLQSWQKNFPKVGYNEKFSNKNILNQWQQLLFCNPKQC